MSSMEKMKSKNRTLMFKITTVLFSIITVLAVFEVTLRVFGPKYYKFGKSSSRYYSNPRGYFSELGAENGEKTYGIAFYKSLEEYRGPDDGLMLAAPEQPYKMLGIGDSFTFGRGVWFSDIYLSQLEKTLRERGLKISIKNCGRVGANIDRAAWVMLQEYKKSSYPLVIYGFVLNDFDIEGQENIKGSDFIDINNGGYTWSRLRQLSAVYNFINFAFEKRRLHNETLNMYLNSFRGEKALRKFELLKTMDRYVKEKNGRLVVVVFPILYNLNKYPFKEIHEKVVSFCKTNDIYVLDLLDSYSKYKDSELWAHPTDHHPNETGHKLAADELYKFLEEEKLLELLGR